MNTGGQVTEAGRIMLALGIATVRLVGLLVWSEGQGTLSQGSGVVHETKAGESHCQPP